MARRWTVSLGLVPLGYVLAAPAADALGATEVLPGGSLIASVAFALGLLPGGTRMLERLDPTPPAVPAFAASAAPAAPAARAATEPRVRVA